MATKNTAPPSPPDEAPDQTPDPTPDDEGDAPVEEPRSAMDDPAHPLHHLRNA